MDVAGDSLAHAWGPFVLVAGLLALGHAAQAEGVFARAADVLVRRVSTPAGLFVVAMLLTTVVTAFLNLDAAVVFVTPVLLGCARAAGLDEAPLLYGVVLMANAASCLLPGANLTNLLLLEGQGGTGADLTRELLPVAVVAALTTALGLSLLAARTWRGTSTFRPGTVDVPAGAWRSVSVLCLLAAAAILVLPEPAPVVLVLGATAAGRSLHARRTTPGGLRDAIGPLSLLALLGAAVLVGVLARQTSLPTDEGPVLTAVLAAASAIVVNNLPAAVAWTAEPVAHPDALLLGLNLGPNLFVTGALSALLWWRAATAAGASPSIWRFSRWGTAVTVPAMALALLVS